MKKSEMALGALRLPADYVAALSAFLLAYYLRPITDLIPGVQYAFLLEQLPPFGEYVGFALMTGVALVLLFAIWDLYSFKPNRSFFREAFKIIFLTSAWLLGIIAYYFLVLHKLFFSRIALAHIWLLTIALVLFGRMLIAMLRSVLLKYGIGRRRVLFVGVNDLADQMNDQLRRDPQYQVLGALSAKTESRKQRKLQIIGTLDQLDAIVKKQNVEEIIQADPDASDQISRSLLSFCRSHQIKYHFIPDLVRLQSTNVEVLTIGEMPLIRLNQTPLEGWGHINKRGFDMLTSFVLIALLTPLWLVVPALIKLDSHGPVIYKSRRRFRDWVFNVYKFRSMVSDADFKKTSLLCQNERRGPLFKIKNDPRVTRLGRFLRKTSLDELPQLFNVLVGNMSLVGPRPHLPEEVAQYEDRHHQVFALKPGITGLAQISGRSNLDFEDEVKLDVYYIENWSLWLDLKILFKTLGVVLRGEGD
ncbi:MAG: sugar transferase [Candidatus Peregrinibacteria bacterium]